MEMMTNKWIIKDKELEFIEKTHTYIYDGVVLPSITQMLKMKFGHKYDFVDKEVLKRASELGTMVHQAIENYERRGEESSLKELRNYKFLKRAYGFECLSNEVPVVLFEEGEPIVCGRLDLVLKEGEKIGLGDIKRTSSLDKEYLGYQLNLYRMAYEQCYGVHIDFLRGVHLREDVRKYVEIPVRELYIRKFIKEYLEANKENKND